MKENKIPSYWLTLEWLLIHAKEIGLRFVEQPWEKNMSQGLYKANIYAEFQHKGTRCFGLGYSANDRLAHVIAAAEAIERAMMLELSLHNSNGCAVHTDLEVARKSSYLELIERDAFLCHFYTGEKLYEIQEVYQLDSWKKIQVWAQSENIRVRFGGLRNSLNLPCGMLVVDHFDSQNPSSFFIGLGIAETWEVVLQKCLPEALRFLNSWYHNSANFAPLTVEEFKKLTGKGVTEHVRLGMDLAYATEFNQRLFPLSTWAMPMSDDSEIHRHVQYLESATHQIWENCPLQFARATNSSLANIGFGDRWTDSFHPERFKRFSPTAKGLEVLPHCLG